MPRIARLTAPGYPHHITQRGNNRTQVFFDDDDRQEYLSLLSKYAQKYFLKIWAWCLMDNHVHLLAVPEVETSLARGIGLTNMLYTQYLNRKLRQSGRIWQNRFFSCVVENNTYLWAVARYIERNPLKVGLAEKAEDYRWSSAKAHLTGARDELLSQPDWLDVSMRSDYADFFRTEDNEQNNLIRKATRTGRLFGSEYFVERLESELNRRIRVKKTGRPHKQGVRNDK